MDTSQEPSIYALLRVTFGDKPSPDMASFVMLKIAEENRVSAPEACKILERDRYVDDLIHSCSTAQDAIQKITSVEKILNTSGFKIKEWHCSSAQLQDQVDKEIKMSISKDHSRRVQNQAFKRNILVGLHDRPRLAPL